MPFPTWNVAVGAGLIAGVVFLMYEMIMMPVFMGAPLWGRRG